MKNIEIPTRQDIIEISRDSVNQKTEYLESKIEVLVKRIYKLEEEIKYLRNYK